MTSRNRVRLLWIAAFLLVEAGNFVVAQNGNSQEHWVATWASSQQQPRAAIGQRGPAPQQPAAAPQAPAGAQPALAAQPAAGQRGAAQPLPAFNNRTVRMIVRTTIGGRRARVWLSNAFGTANLNIGAAHLGVRNKDSEIVAGTDRALMFNGKPSVTIPPGAQMVSDPVDLNVPKLGDLAVSVYVSGDAGAVTTHALGLRTTYIADQEGDLSAQPAIADATNSQSWYWLAGVDVMAPADAAAIVAFGDSITDGATSTADTNRSWPSVLAERLAANRATANIAIINHGISGNRILGDGAGVSALARFDRDVLSQAGVKWVMILEGINDIGGGARGNPVTSYALIGAMRQMIERAHTHGIKVIGCTLTPFQGAGYYSDEGETIRETVNNWIRNSGSFDAVVDFDAATRDPANPKQFLAKYNISDHLHPNDAGYKAMADAVDLSIFTKR